MMWKLGIGVGDECLFIVFVSYSVFGFIQTALDSGRIRAVTGLAMDTNGHIASAGWFCPV